MNKWRFSKEPAGRETSGHLFTKGIDYASRGIGIDHWDKIRVYDDTATGAHMLAHKIVSLLNAEPKVPYAKILIRSDTPVEDYDIEVVCRNFLGGIIEARDHLVTITCFDEESLRYNINALMTEPYFVGYGFTVSYD